MEGNSVLVAKGEAEEKGEKEKTSEAGHQKGCAEGRRRGGPGGGIWALS